MKHQFWENRHDCVRGPVWVTCQMVLFWIWWQERFIWWVKQESILIQSVTFKNSYSFKWFDTTQYVAWKFRTGNRWMHLKSYIAKSKTSINFQKLWNPPTHHQNHTKTKKYNIYILFSFFWESLIFKMTLKMSQEWIYFWRN